MSDNFKHDEAYYLGVLVLPKDFDMALLKKAYRREAMKWHPDKNPDDTYAEERLKLVIEAYEFLRSKVKSTEEQEEYNEEDYFWFKGKRYKRGNRDPKEKGLDDIISISKGLGWIKSQLFKSK